MKTAVIYARYSSERQTEQSIEGQLTVCQDFAQRNDMVVVHTYIDRATTGTNDNRAQFQRMLKDSKKQAWDIVIVYKLDRFSRDKYEMAIHRKALRDNGVKLVSAMENIPDSPEGIILESMLEGMAQYYSAELSQKVKRGFNENRRKGLHTGGYLLYGYKAQDRRLFINEEEAEIVRYIYQQYAAEVIVEDIIADLTNKGIFNRGKPFQRGTVYNMLKNEKYSGVYKFDGEVYTDIYPQIVPTNIFEIVKRKARQKHKNKYSVQVVYVLKNKLTCGYCGRHINAETGTSVTGTVGRYYKCFGRKLGEKCKKTTVRKDVLEDLIVNSTIQILEKPETMSIIVEAVMQAQKIRQQDQSVLTILLQEQNETKRAIANLMTAIEKGIINNSTKSRLDELEERLSSLTEKIAIEQAESASKISKEEIVGFIKYALKQKPRQMVDLLIERIILYDDKALVYFKHSELSQEKPEEIVFYQGNTSDLLNENDTKNAPNIQLTYMI